MQFTRTAIERFMQDASDDELRHAAKGALLSLIPDSECVQGTGRIDPPIGSQEAFLADLKGVLKWHGVELYADLCGNHVMFRGQGFYLNAEKLAAWMDEQRAAQRRASFNTSP